MTIEEISKLTLKQVQGNVIYERELKRTYFELFKSHLTITCGGCIDDAIYNIRYYLNKQNKKVMNSSNTLFRFFSNVVLYVPKWHEHITNDNLTDSRAIELLRLTQANIKHFEKFPDNWKELVAGKVADDLKSIEVEKEKPDDENETDEVVTPTIDQLIQLNTKDQLVDKLIEKGIKIDHSTTLPKATLAQNLINILTKE